MTADLLHVRRAAVGDERLLRELRLEALTDAPVAFGSTYARELARTTEDWRRWISPPAATFVLEVGGQPRGMVAAMPEPDAAAGFQLMAMWVHPDMRGRRGAAALVAAVVDWARTQGAQSVRLYVVDTNARARRCYEKHGFTLTTHTRLRERDGATELLMRRPV